MNLLKIIGIILIVATGIELLNIITDYSSGKLESWPFGVEIGAFFTIWLGFYLIKSGNNRNKNTL